MQQFYKGLPVYIVDLEDCLWNNVALVNSPAIQVDFLKFSEQEELKFSIDEEKRIVTGPVLIPEQMIYRRMDNGKEFYIKFTEEMIKNAAIEFFRQGRENEGNVEHSVSVNGITFYESYLKDDTRGIVPVEFSDLPNGTWFLSAKVENDDVWELVKNGTIKGFSIDMRALIMPEEISVIDSLEELVDYINNNK